MVTPNNPTKYKGTDQYLVPFITRNRRPLSSDIRQPETGRYYPIFSSWQVGKDPTTGAEGELWLLSKIVANVGYWVHVAGGSSDVGDILTLTGNDAVAVVPDASGNVNVLGSVVANSLNASAVYVKNTSANTETLQVQVGAAIASTNIAKVGLVAFDNTQFTVDANGFVALVGSDVPATKGLIPQAHTAPGTTPVVANGSGNINVYGFVVNAIGIPLQTNSTVANQLDIDIQLTSAQASSNAANAGLASFNSANFTVDANGYASITGSSGNFTPAISGSSSAGVGTYTTQSGSYIRINKLITVAIQLVWTAHTGTGNITITGLPFAASGTGASTYTVSGDISEIVLPANALTNIFFLPTASSTISVAVTRDTATHASVVMAAGGSISFVMTYFTA